MSKAALGATRATVKQWFVWQAIVIVAVSLLFLVFSGLDFAQSVFLGGMLCQIPNIMFARWWFSSFTASAPSQMLKVFYVGEMLKLLVTGILFVAILRFLSINVIGCVIGYMFAQIAFWVAPLVKKR